VIFTFPIADRTRWGDQIRLRRGGGWSLA